MGEPSQAHAETRQRLLEAAGELFAEGFHVAATRFAAGQAPISRPSIITLAARKPSMKQCCTTQTACWATRFQPPPRWGARGAPARNDRVGTEPVFCPGQPEWRWKFIEQATIGLTPSLQAFFDSKILPILRGAGLDLPGVFGQACSPVASPLCYPQHSRPVFRLPAFPGADQFAGYRRDVFAGGTTSIDRPHRGVFHCGAERPGTPLE